MYNRKILLVIFLFLHTLLVRAQFKDDFSDNDYLTNPEWHGDHSKFTISGGRLKLQAPAASGTASLTTVSQAVHEATWEFSIQMDFTPSSSNYAKVYLMSDQTDLLSALNGYFLKIGSTTREVSLYVQTGTKETEIIDGLDDRLNLPIVSLRVRVTRSASGLWEVFTKMDQGSAFVKEGETIDITHQISAHFGLVCTYTSTRSDKFWFDDFVVAGSVVPDTTPPQMLSVTVLDSINIETRFSEPLDEVKLTVLSNATIEGLGSPIGAALSSDQIKIVWTIQSPLTNGVGYTLRISGISDIAGNVMIPVEANIMFLRPGFPGNKDIIITEVFADPSPQIGLPDAEYIELFNRTSKPFDLTGWKLSDGSSTAVFSSAVILPGSYRIIASVSAAQFFSNPNQVIGLSNFPSLNNSGDAVILSDPTGQTIDSIRYTLDWYRDEDKAGGGWSLELIDPDNPCGEGDNWAASENIRGGTPGFPNSVLASKPDITPPNITNVLPAGSRGLSIFFNEALMKSTPHQSQVSISPEIEIGSLRLETTLREIRIEFSEDLLPQTLYTIELKGISDCSGNNLESNKFQFGLPESADSLDVIINEILVNPRSGGVDFVELYNKTDKFLSLDRWAIGNGETRTPLQNRLLYPRSFVVLTKEPSVILQQYPSAIAENLMAANLPSLPDDQGRIVIYSDTGLALDDVAYDHSWHSVFLKSEEGVSLERIDPLNGTNEKNNWISASAYAGFATPGAANSQERNATQTEGEIEIVPEIFSSGGASQNFVEIRYRFDQIGLVGNVMILNQQGGIVKQISNNDFLGTEGFFRWEGQQEDGTRASAGYYVVWFETFDNKGNVATFRRRAVIVRP